MKLSEYLDELQQAKVYLDGLSETAVEYINEALTAIDAANSAVGLAMQRIEDMWDSADYEGAGVDGFLPPDEMEFDDQASIDDSTWTAATESWSELVRADADLKSAYEDLEKIQRTLDRIDTTPVEYYGG